MRTPRAILALALALLTSLALATTAFAANVPKGQGLTSLAEHGIYAIECTDPTIGLDDVIIPRGGGAATWITDGRFYVTQSFHIAGTITTPEGTFPIEFSQEYGKKRGLEGSQITCTFHVQFEENGTTGHAVGTVVLYRVR
jgi:hypothetical protein